jgi:hypothetical protein
MNYQQYLPSKQFVRNVGIILLGILCVIGLYYGAQAMVRYFKNVRKEKVGDVVVDTAVKDLLAIDHDKDGLPDWEESLWGMDPNKSDTDGNGVLDGAEVAPKRNGLIQKAQTASAEDGLSLNTTELFLRELLLNSTALSQAGTISEGGAENFLGPAVDAIGDIQIGKVYTRADLNIVSTITIQDIYTYTTAVNKVFKQNLIGEENAIAVALGALREKDPAPLQKLSKFVTQYDAVVQTLRKVPVPEPLADIHLRLVNDFAFFSANVTALQGVFTDPLPAFASVTQYQNRLDLYIKHVDDYETVINYVLKKYSLIYS